MGKQWGNPVAVATEMQGHYVQGRDKIVPPPFWTDAARICWPNKTAAYIATIAGKDERTAKRWLAGEFDPPYEVAFALFQELFRRRG